MNPARRLRPADPAVSPRFGDVATLLRAPRVPPGPGIDIALVGVPFDLGTNYRTGARGGPAAVREASRTMRLVHPTSRIAPFDLCEVADIGDVAINAMDLAASIGAIEAFFRDLHTRGTTPITVGGDHTVPLPILRAIARDRPVGVVQFDAHPDTLDTLMGTRINHATTFRRAVEEGLIDPKRTVQVGLRGSQFSADDAAWGSEAGMRVITMDEFEALGRAGVIAEIGRVVGDGPTYVSFDIDGLDAANAMGTGVPEVGGFSVRDAQVMLQSLRGRRLVGADLCEVAPMYDPTGQTALNAANLLFELLCVLADSRVAQGASSARA
ncbi:MAG TPA: agmatinase [Acetobacteraceae bacterium]|nr:agmatinase [Acetobacteraceae bacterium]